MDAAKPTAFRKTNHETSAITCPDAEAWVGRYQVHRQNCTGHFLPGFRTGSAPEAIGAFLNQYTTFDGGGVRLLNHRDQRMVASVEWTTLETDFGFPVHHRVNRCHDAMIEKLADEFLAR